MKSSIIKNKDKLPMFTSVMDMIALLGISRTKAYELVGKEGFPIKFSVNGQRCGQAHFEKKKKPCKLSVYKAFCGT